MKATHQYGSTVVLSFLLAGCFLKQQPPAGTVVQSGSAEKVAAVVRLEDVHGSSPMASIEASFYTVTQDRLADKVGEWGGAGREMRGVRSSIAGLLPARVPDCKAYKGPKAKSELLDSVLLSAGKLWMGVTGTLLTEIKQEVDGRYFRRLNPGLAPAVYTIKTEGSSQVAGFEVSLVLPSPMAQLKIGDRGFDDGSVVAKDAGLDLTWDPALSGDANHIVMMELYSDQPTEIQLLRCQGMESEFALGAKRVWKIPAKLLTFLSPTDDGLLFLSRIIARGAGNQNLTVETQGFQTEFVRVKLE